MVQKRKLSSAEKPIKPVKSGSKILKPASGEKVAMEPIPENSKFFLTITQFFITVVNFCYNSRNG